MTSITCSLNPLAAGAAAVDHSNAFPSRGTFACYASAKSSAPLLALFVSISWPVLTHAQTFGTTYRCVRAVVPDIKGILGYGNWSRQPQGHASGELISNCANIHTWQWMAKALTPSPDTAAQKQWTMSADYEFAATSKVYKLKDIH
eukprot:scaffold130191_cov18-Tisochrysis_lutea.AAC.2